MQVKCEVFSRFASLVNFSSGGPLGGVGASTVGADLCVRQSSPERSLFCGRTRRSAPTQATSARQFHASNAVTPISVGTARPCVCCVSAKRVTFLPQSPFKLARPMRHRDGLAGSRWQGSAPSHRASSTRGWSESCPHW